ncbi:MAG: carboxypeptidase-like regulatory domain-containing protein [Bacteroidales bacterium]|nr:carboxypeptidase-like regulatory domain-containing protein [Bacteroidales bacterium]
MMNVEKLKEKKRKLIRAFFGLFSFSAVMFVFQACYGMPNDYGLDVSIEGNVVSKVDNQPIQGIRVTVEGYSYNYGITDSNGHYSFYNQIADKYTLKFTDEDSLAHGAYKSLDTTIVTSADIKKIVLNIALEEAN